MKKRNLDDIHVRYKAENVCLTDLTWSEAQPLVEEMLCRSNDPIRSYMGLLEHFHQRIRELGEACDVACDR